MMYCSCNEIVLAYSVLTLYRTRHVLENLVTGGWFYTFDRCAGLKLHSKYVVRCNLMVHKTPNRK